MKKLLLPLIAVLFFTQISTAQTILDENFDTYLPTNWTEIEGLLANPSTIYDNSSRWIADGFANVGYTGAAKINIYTTYGTCDEWLVTPSLDIGTGGNYKLEFDLALTEVYTTNEATLGDDDKFAVVISTDDGATWYESNTLRLWTSATPVSNVGEHIIISLAAYTGTVKIGFYGESTIENADVDVFIDNVVVDEISVSPVFTVAPSSKDYGTLTIPATSSQDFIISNTGSGTITISSADDIVLSGTNADMFNITKPTTYPIILTGAATETITVEYAPTAQGNHTASLDITDDTKAVHNVALSGECLDPILTPPFVIDFNDGFPPNFWTEFRGLLENPVTIDDPNYSSWLEGNYANTGTLCPKINIYGTSVKEWMVTPTIDLGTGTDYQLEFDLALTEYGGTTGDALGADDKFAVVISIDNGTTWTSLNTLREWNSTTPISTNEHIVISLVGYTGLIKIGFYAESTEGGGDDVDLFVDNVEVKEEPIIPVFYVTPGSKDYGTMVIPETSSQDFIVSNTGVGTITIANAGDVIITGTDASMFILTTTETFPITLSGATTATFTVEYAPDTEGSHTASLQITDDQTKTVNNVPLSGICIDPRLYPPFLIDFAEGYAPDYWTEFKGLLEDPVVPSGSTSAWSDFGFANNGTTGSANINIYGMVRKDWAITPSIVLGTGTDYQLEFDLALTEYDETTEATLGTDDIFAVVISTDDGVTWTSLNTLQEWNSTTPISNTGDHIVISLATYTGQVKIGFYGESTISNEDVDLFVDNVQVRVAPTEPEFTIDPTSKDFDIIQINSTVSQDFVITNTGAGTLTITEGGVVLSGTNAGMFSTSATYPIELASYENATITVEYTPTTELAHTASLDITDNTTKAVHNIALSGTGIDYTITPPYTQGFEDIALPSNGWIADMWSLGTEAYQGSYCAQTEYNHEGEAILMTPPVDLTGGNYSISFYWKDDDITKSGEKVAEHDTTFFEILPQGATEWTELAFLSASSPMTEYVEVYLDLSAYNGQTVYIRWRDINDGSYSAYGTAVDNIYITDLASSDDATLSDLTVDGTTVTGFSPSVYSYDVELPHGTTTVPVTDATTTHVNASFVVNDAPSLPGTTDVVVTAENGTTNLTYSVNFTVAGSIDDLSENNITISPNPSNGKFNISVTETLNLEVIDITGKVVKSQVLNNNTNTVYISEQGIYILKFTNNNTSVTHRIIVNK